VECCDGAATRGLVRRREVLAGRERCSRACVYWGGRKPVVGVCSGTRHRCHFCHNGNQSAVQQLLPQQLLLRRRCGTLWLAPTCSATPGFVEASDWRRLCLQTTVSLSGTKVSGWMACAAMALPLELASGEPLMSDLNSESNTRTKKYESSNTFDIPG
jgi:hypothetical protein